MEEIKKRATIIADGFFYFFGFIGNPAAEDVDLILNQSASEKIKKDLKKLNKDYRRAYSEMRKEVLCLEQ